MERTTRLLIAVAVSAAIVFFVALALDLYTVRMASKPVVVIAMIVWVRLRGRDRYGALILAGLVASLAGDVLLEASPDFFLFGLVAFLLGHLCYVAAYVSRSRSFHLGRALPWVAYGVAMYALVSPQLGEMAIPVAVYTTVICTMVWRAWETSTSLVPKGAALYALAGAATFAVSDGLIALNKFHAPIDGVRYAIMALYWLGQLGIARSVAPAPQPAAAE
jgi:uncharacterized membrane protein YhhN